MTQRVKTKSEKQRFLLGAVMCGPAHGAEQHRFIMLTNGYDYDVSVLFYLRGLELVMGEGGGHWRYRQMRGLSILSYYTIQMM